MSAAALNVAFDDIARLACEPAPALRIALLYGEELRIPVSATGLRVLSGTAWVSFEARDYVLERGDEMEFRPSRHRAIVSPLRGEAAFLELT
jgi:hypothetical protein